MNNTKYINYLKSLGACNEAVQWSKDAGDVFSEIWNSCDRGDWMMWLLSNLIDRKSLVLLACKIARKVSYLVPDGEDRPRVAIETAEQWANREGGVTLADVRTAAYGAAAAGAAAAVAAAHAAAADAADAAVAAVAAAHAAAARCSEETLDIPAIIRAEYTAEVVEELITKTTV